MPLSNVRPSDKVPASDRPTTSEEAPLARKVTMVYQDRTTREWALELWARPTQTFGKENIQTSAWRISDLARLEVLALAARSAAQADVIVVSVLAQETLPLELPLWIAAWLRQRPRGAGALLLLVGASTEASAWASRTLAFFQVIARQGGLEYAVQQRLLPSASGETCHRNQHGREATTPQGKAERRANAPQCR